MSEARINLHFHTPLDMSVEEYGRLRMEGHVLIALDRTSPLVRLLAHIFHDNDRRWLEARAQNAARRNEE